ncbi:hypothetical protein [Teichococcus aestuarii]|uniref:hypothetical protein n=1 Tax=Teichococcus aestuarii TaxID=568898 RepID=UPI00361D1CFE
MIIQPTPRPETNPVSVPSYPVLGGSSEVARQARLMEIYRPDTRVAQEPVRRAPSWFDRA